VELQYEGISLNLPEVETRLVGLNVWAEGGALGVQELNSATPPIQKTPKRPPLQKFATVCEAIFCQKAACLDGDSRTAEHAAALQPGRHRRDEDSFSVMLMPLVLGRLYSKEQPARSHHIHRCVSAIGSQMPHDPAYVVLDGELRQLQACRDLFVGHPTGHQSHQLPLPARQCIRRVAAGFPFCGVCKKSLREMFEQAPA
jgi:hypothetical protein